MERSLHRELKDRYGPMTGGRTEVVVGPFRIDAIGSDDRLIEIQSGPLRLLRNKLERLLPDRSIGVVKPIIVRRRLILRDRVDGPDLKARNSPRRGALIEVFDDLVGLARIFPHVNLRVDILAVAVDEIRVNRRRKPGFLVVDRRLREVVETVHLRDPCDLWNLLPADLPGRFTTRDLASHLGRSIDFAQRVAYCLRTAGAAVVAEKVGPHRVYQRALV